MGGNDGDCGPEPGGDDNDRESLDRNRAGGGRCSLVAEFPIVLYLASEAGEEPLRYSCSTEGKDVACVVTASVVPNAKSVYGRFTPALLLSVVAMSCKHHMMVEHEECLRGIIELFK